MRKLLLTGCAVALALGSHGPRVTARQQTAPSSDTSPSLRVTLTGAYGRGGASGGLLLERDTWWEVTLYAGEREAAGSTLCLTGAVMGVPGTRVDLPRDKDPAVTWHVAARLVEFRGDTATIDLRWRREPRSGDLEPAVARETQVRWTVPEGGQTVLDTVHATAQGDGTCASTAVTAEFGIDSAFEFSQAAIAYDAWLVQRLPSGETRTHHVRTTGQQGDAVPMMFPLVPIESRDRAEPPLDLWVHGTIRGRLRTDGSIEVSVDAGRQVRTREASMSVGTMGRSHLRMGLGETVEFAPPPLHGNVGGHQLAAVFAGAPTAIRIRATRLW